MIFEFLQQTISYYVANCIFLILNQRKLSTSHSSFPFFLLVLRILRRYYIISQHGVNTLTECVVLSFFDV